MDELPTVDQRSPRHRRRFDSIFKLLLQRVEWAHWWLEAFASLPAGQTERLTAWPTEWVSEDLEQSRSDKLFLAGDGDGMIQGLVLLECQERYVADMGARLQHYAYAALDTAEANGIEAAAGPGFWVHATVFHVGDYRWPARYDLLGTAVLPGGDAVMVREPVRVVDIHDFPEMDGAAGTPWECIIQLFKISHALRTSWKRDQVAQALSRIRHQVAGLDALLPEDRALRRQATAAVQDLFAYDLAELGYEFPRDVTLEDAAMLYNTIAEGIKAAFEDAKAEGIEVGKAEGLEQGIEVGKAEGLEQGIEMGKAEGIEQGIEMGKAEDLAVVVAHRFPAEAEAFRQFLASSNRDMWPRMSEVLTWAGTGTEFMAWLADGQPAAS